MIVTLGLSKILGKVGEPTSGDFNETGYTPYGLTYQDTAKMQQEDGNETEFFCEELDDAVDSIESAGKTTFTFSIMNPDLPTLKRLFGGEIASDIWGYPDVVANVEESLIILPRKGLKFQIPRAKVKAKFNGEFSKKGLLLLEVTATVRPPETAGLLKMFVGYVNKPNTTNS